MFAIRMIFSKMDNWTFLFIYLFNFFFHIQYISITLNSNRNTLIDKIITFRDYIISSPFPKDIA